jgi:hypothetical protein
MHTQSTRSPATPRQPARRRVARWKSYTLSGPRAAQEKRLVRREGTPAEVRVPSISTREGRPERTGRRRGRGRRLLRSDTLLLVRAPVACVAAGTGIILNNLIK